MRILVDADACPVVDIAIKLAKKNNIEIILYYDDSHITDKDYAKIVVVSQDRDAVDLKIIEELLSTDIVITQDYGLAALVLSKGAHAINQNGMIYNDFNIDSLLFFRAESQRLRRSSKNHLKGPKKRALDDNKAFALSLEKLIGELL